MTQRNAAIRAHDKCKRIPPLNCRKKQKFSLTEKLLLSDTNTGALRGKLFTTLSLSLCFRKDISKWWSMRFFLLPILRFLLVFLFYRLKLWFNSIVKTAIRLKRLQSLKFTLPLKSFTVNNAAPISLNCLCSRHNKKLKTLFQNSFRGLSLPKWKLETGAHVKRGDGGEACGASHTEKRVIVKTMTSLCRFWN